jgi:hypothetical protein
MGPDTIDLGQGEQIHGNQQTMLHANTRAAFPRNEHLGSFDTNDQL